MHSGEENISFLMDTAMKAFDTDDESFQTSSTATSQTSTGDRIKSSVQSLIRIFFKVNDILMISAGIALVIYYLDIYYLQTGNLHLALAPYTGYMGLVIILACFINTIKIGRQKQFYYILFDEVNDFLWTGLFMGFGVVAIWIEVPMAALIGIIMFIVGFVKSFGVFKKYGLKAEEYVYFFTSYIILGVIVAAPAIIIASMLAEKKKGKK